MQKFNKTYRLTLFIFLATFLTFFHIQAQEVNKEAEILWDEGIDLLIRRGKPEDSREKFIAAQKIYIKANDMYNEAKCEMLLGYSFNIMGENKVAKEKLENAINIINPNLDSQQFMRLKASVLKQIMDIHFDENNIELATSYGKQSILYYKKSGNILASTPTLGKLGEIYLEKNEMKKALNYFEKIINYSEKYKLEIEQDTSLSEDQKKIEIHNAKSALGQGYNYMGVYYDEQLDYVKSLSNYEKAYKIKKDIYEHTHPEVTGVLYNIAYIQNEIGLINEAQKNVNIALAGQLEKNQMKEELASTYALLGKIEMNKKNYEKAITSIKKAIDTAKKTLENNHTDFQYLLGLLSEANLKIKNYSEAEEYCLKSLSISTNKSDITYLSNLTALGEIQSHIRIQKAEKTLNKALGISKGLNPTQKKNIQGKIYFILGKMNIVEHPEKSLEYLQKSNDLLIQIHTTTPNQILPENSLSLAILDPKNNIQHIENGIQYCLKSNNTELKKIETYDIIFPETLLSLIIEKFNIYKSNNDIYNCAKTIEQFQHLSNQIKPLYNSTTNQKNLNNKKYSFYKEALPYLAKENIYRPRKELRDCIFSIIQQSKSLELIDALLEHEAYKKGGIPDSLYHIELNLKTQLQNLRNTKNTEKIDRLENEYKVFMNQIEEKYPNYYEAKYKYPNISIEKIQSSLKEGELYIEYFFTDKNLYIFSASPKKSELYQKKLPNNLNFLIDRLKSFIQNKNHKELKTSLTELSDLLLHRELKKYNGTKKVIINPYGIIGQIPFDILIQDNGNYLIQDYIISYQHSVQHLIKEKNTRKGNINFYGIAPTYKGKIYKKLPFAQKEILAINKLFNGITFIGEDATRKNFISSLYPNAILHLSGHTELNMDDPSNSRLVFSGKDSTRYLYVYELYNHRINTIMMTLSACNTGTGRVKEQEGVMSVARAFSYAGCPSTTSTLWAVSDKPTSEIMIHYYQNLEKGQEKSIALRNAKLNYLKTATPRMSSPLYWAGFIHIGDDSPIVIEASMTWIWILGFIFVILIFIIINSVAKKKNK